MPLSQDSGDGETRLQRGLFCLAAQATDLGHLVAPTPLLRLSQARGHLRTRQVFMHEIHLLAPVRFGVHQLGWILLLGETATAHAAVSFLRGRPRGRLRGITPPWRKS